MQSYFMLAGGLVGTGFSFLRWGDEDGVHGIGLPFPVSIQGLPEPQATHFSFLANLGFLGPVFNIAVAILVAMVIWSIMSITARLWSSR